jgi:putative tryptophan/tyrosine transport system substrate-binding protein
LSGERHGPLNALGIQRLSLEVRTPDELDNAIERATRARVDGLIVLRNPLFYVLRKRMVTLAEEGRLPVMHPIGDFVEVGGLMSYSGNNDAQYRRAATFVDKILKGTKPADLPLGAPTKFELVVNLKTAKRFRPMSWQERIG